jgi:Concanavalin A-like lectin/glucanases superfamily
MKKILILGTLLCAIIAVNGGETIASWKLGELQKSTVTGAKGHKAVLKGKFDKSKLIQEEAMRFNNGKYQLVVQPDKALDLINNFTITCKFKAAKVNYFRTLLWKGNRKVSPQQINYYVSIHDGKMEFKFKDTKGSWKVFHTTNPVIKPGNWYTTVMAVKDGAVTTYVNGKKQQLNRQKIIVKKLVKNDAPLYIGAGSNGNSIAYSFDGLIKSIKITKGINIPTAK